MWKKTIPTANDVEAKMDGRINARRGVRCVAAREELALSADWRRTSPRVCQITSMDQFLESLMWYGGRCPVLS